MPSSGELSDPLFLGGGSPGDGTSTVLLPLSGGEPPVATLPNYDTDRNDDPGLTVLPTSLGTWAETDPARLQRFTTTVTEATWVKGPATLTMYLAAEGFVTDELLVEASIYHCNPEGCEKLKKRLVWFAADGQFSPVAFEYEWLNRQFAAGDRLEVRIATWHESEHNLLVAYGTAEYPSVLELDVYEPS